MGIGVGFKVGFRVGTYAATAAGISRELARYLKDCTYPSFPVVRSVIVEVPVVCALPSSGAHNRADVMIQGRPYGQPTLNLFLVIFKHSHSKFHCINWSLGWEGTPRPPPASRAGWPDTSRSVIQGVPSVRESALDATIGAILGSGKQVIVSPR